MALSRTETRIKNHIAFERLNSHQSEFKESSGRTEREPRFDCHAASSQTHSPGPRQREVLARLFAHRRYPKNAVVLHRGERSNVMFVVCRGTIQLSTEHDWGHATVISQGEGDVFGEEILLGGVPSPYQATALEDCELCVLDRSDLDELSAQAPTILAEIIERVARRLRSISESLQDQSRRRIDDQLLATPSIETRAARFLASRGGSVQALALFVIALAAWLYVGTHGIPLFHLKAFDPSPFSMLSLILKVMAAVWAAVILLVLNRIPRRDEFDARSWVKLLESLQVVERSLDRHEERLRDRHLSATAIREPENSRRTADTGLARQFPGCDVTGGSQQDTPGPPLRRPRTLCLEKELMDGMLHRPSR